MAVKRKFSELKIELAAAGFFPIPNEFHRRVVELRRCRRCHRFLTYCGFADKEKERSFGVCTSCDFYEEFFASEVECIAKAIKAGS